MAEAKHNSKWVNIQNDLIAVFLCCSVNIIIYIFNIFFRVMVYGCELDVMWPGILSTSNQSKSGSACYMTRSADYRRQLLFKLFGRMNPCIIRVSFVSGSLSVLCVNITNKNVSEQIREIFIGHITTRNTAFHLFLNELKHCRCTAGSVCIQNRSSTAETGQKPLSLKI